MKHRSSRIKSAQRSQEQLQRGSEGILGWFLKEEKAFVLVWEGMMHFSLEERALARMEWG